MPELNAIRQTLQAEAVEIAARVVKIEAHLRGVDRDAPDDWSDRAQFLENDEVLERLDDHERARLEAIKNAIDRIDAGHYAECTGCGKDIPLARLKALPHTTVCVKCAAG
jgi:DnaK suppressor protein